MKLLNKTIKILLIIAILVTASLGNAGPKVQAATFFIEEASLYSKGSYGNMLRYNGVEVLTTFVVYQKDGVEYPAYCLDADMPGVGEHGSYIAKVDSLLNDVMLWRVITNGYPYKTVEQLGCKTKEEAFAATKQAVYSMIYGREASWYEPIGEQGNRVRNAMAQILKNARASTVGKPSSNIEIKAKQDDWKMDSIWTNCLSQTFEITASTSYNTYQVKLEGNYPAETKIVDEKNQIKNTFSTGERFKIVMPLKNLKQAGNFRIQVTTKLNTKPVLYGKAPSGDLQDYALTASVYEDAQGSKQVSYFKNETKVEIKKQEDKTLKPLSGVEFRILDNKKSPVYTNLITDNQGRIVLENLLPGKYYLEEVKTVDGYLKYEGQIAFDLELNQTLTIKVNNTLEKKNEYTSNKQDITVTQSKQEIVVNNKQEHSSKQENETIINETHQSETSNENVNIQNQTNSEVILNQNSNTNNNKVTNNLAIYNKNENKNENEQNQNTNINNENTNINNNTQNQDTNIHDENININNNTQNQDTNIHDENTNINNNTQNQNTNIHDENTNINTNTQNQNTNIHDENTNINTNTQNQNTNIHDGNTNINTNTQNQNTNIQDANTNINSNTQNQNTNIHVNNQNTNTNIQNQNENINMNHQNSNTNISSLNGVVKLPKTGM